MSAMVERVAKAIAIELDGDDTKHATFQLGAYKAFARAAIKAMREPEPGMLDAADRIVPQGFLWGTRDDMSGTRQIWRAMIDEAMK
jgi:hypothetical protein